MCCGFRPGCRCIWRVNREAPLRVTSSTGCRWSRKAPCQCMIGEQKETRRSTDRYAGVPIHKQCFPPTAKTIRIQVVSELQATAPEYDFTKINKETVLYWGDEDWLADPTDIDDFLLPRINGTVIVSATLQPFSDLKRLSIDPDIYICPFRIRIFEYSTLRKKSNTRIIRLFEYSQASNIGYSIHSNILYQVLLTSEWHSSSKARQV